MVFIGSYKVNLAQVAHRDCEKNSVSTVPSIRKTKHLDITENNKNLPVSSVVFLVAITLGSVVQSAVFGYHMNSIVNKIS